MGAFFGDFFSLFKSTYPALKFILNLWWLWLPILSGYVFFVLWLSWRRAIFLSGVSYALLEVRIPREIQKSPKAMEQVLNNICALRNIPGNFKEKWWDGDVVLWFSFEITSFGGEIHFYVRTPLQHAGVLKANLYAQYLDIEIEEVEDYMDRFPKTIPELYRAGLGIWGSELILGKPSGYPIRTYLQFESIEEAQNLDPISALLEILSKVKREDAVLVQMLARPADPVSWPEAVKKEVEVLKEKTTVKSKSAKGEEFEYSSRTPGETELMKQVEAKAFKPAFETSVRIVYLGPESAFNADLAKRGVRGAFNQYSSPNLNFFLSNLKTQTQASVWSYPYFFPRKVAERRKRRMYRNYRMRIMPERFSFLNTEEFATIFHFPTSVVLTGPIIKRSESRKIGPPAGLSIFKED